MEVENICGWKSLQTLEGEGGGGVGTMKPMKANVTHSLSRLVTLDGLDDGSRGDGLNGLDDLLDAGFSHFDKV